MVCGIYLIENTKTKQKYIGQSNNIKRRIREHKIAHDKNSMYRNQRKPNPCACFSFQYNGKTILGKRFIDFYTPELLYYLTNVFNE